MWMECFKILSNEIFGTLRVLLPYICYYMIYLKIKKLKTNQTRHSTVVKLVSARLVNKFPVFSENPNFITVSQDIFPCPYPQPIS
jgi:hypothetical protein